MPGNAVVARQPLVDERVVGAQQIEHAAILAQRAGDEQLGLLLERLEQAVVEVRIDVRMHDDLVDAAQVQPLRGEVVDERRRSRAGRRACAAPAARAPPAWSAGRARPGRAAARRGCCSTGRTTAATPARDRSAGTRRPSRRAAGRIAMDAQQEVGIDEHALERELDAGVEAAAVAPAVVEERRAACRHRRPSPAGDRRAARCATGSSSRRRARRPRGFGWQTKIARRLGVSFAGRVDLVRARRSAPSRRSRSPCRAGRWSARGRAAAAAAGLPAPTARARTRRRRCADRP